MTASFPEIRTAALAQLPADTGLDGELVVREWDQLAFERLQQRLARRRAATAQAALQWPAHYVIFDLLPCGRGPDRLAVRAAGAALQAIFTDHGLEAPLTLCPSTTAAALARGEGLCFKQLDQPYRPVLSSPWTAGLHPMRA
ncbi:hypothetical protein [Streptomyces sp. NPDC002676]